MITWNVGRSGVGKTTESIRQAVMWAKEYPQVCFLVPEQSSMALERQLGREGLQGVEVVSFRRLCNVIFRQFGGVAGTYMSKPRQTALIYRILQENRQKLHYYRKARVSMGFVSRLADAFSELSLSGLTEEAVLPLLKEKNRPDWVVKYQDLFLLYQAYQNALNEDQRSAGEDLRVATDLARENGFFRDRPLVIDGFFGFTGAQRELLKVAFAQSPRVMGTLLLDPEDPALCFEPAKRELWHLQRLAQEAGASFKTQVLSGPSKRNLPKDLAFLEQWFMAENAPAEQPPAAEHIRMMEGRNIREELGMVAVDIARKVRAGARYRDFALIAGSLEPYGPVAESVFEKYGVPLFVDEGRPSLSKPLFAFVQNALQMIRPDRYFQREDVLAFLRTDLCNEDRDLVSRLENYTQVWKISGERWVRDADWTQNPRGMDKKVPGDEELLAELNGLRNRIRGPLLAFRETCKPGTGKALAQGIYELLKAFRVEEQMIARAEGVLKQSAQNSLESAALRRKSREYQQIYSAMMDILDDIYSVFGDHPLSLYTMQELIGLCGEELALNVAPPTTDAVTLGTVAHSRLENVRELYVVGANQGLLPMPVADSGLIGERERRLFNEHQLPCNATLQQNLLQGRHRLYSALFSAPDGITFSYSAFEADGTPKLASPYIGRLKELIQPPLVRRADMDFYDFAVTRGGARELMSWEPALQKPILAELQETLPPAVKEDPRLPEAVIRRIFGDRLWLSYSQIGLYQKCPFQYFMKQTMGLKKTQPVTFDKNNIGTFVHYGLELLTNQVIAGGYHYEEYTPDKIQQFGEQVARDYLADQLRDLEDTPRFRALYQRMTGLLCRVAENVLGEWKEGRYRPVEAEFSLDRVELPLKDGRNVRLIGSIDRVDTYETEGITYLKVTDYKTGKQEFQMEGVTNRTGVQLPIYLYGAIKSGKWQNPSPALGCYLEAHQPAFNQPVSPEELPDKIREFYRRAGVISMDPVALDGLDAERGSRYFKLRYNKNGNLDSRVKVYEPEIVQEMVEHMEEVIRETAEGILSGNTQAIPLKGGPLDPCKYCDFNKCCHHNEETDAERLYDKDGFAWRKGQEG